MALVQRAHGRYQSDGLTGLAPSGDAATQIGDSAGNLGTVGNHGAVFLWL
jgi:hypothetical protein